MKHVVLVWSVLLLAGCLRPAEERAEMDREVGHAQAGGATLAVDGGLAVVRRRQCMEPGGA